MAIFNKRATFTKEQLLDHYLKRNSITDILYAVVRVLGIIVQNLYCISSYLVLSWLVLLPVNWLQSDLYSRLENYLYNSLLFIVSSWSLAADLTVVEAGDEFKHLIEEPEKHDPRLSNNNNNGINNHSDDKNCRLDLRETVTKKNSNNTDRYLDDLLDSDQQNGLVEKNTNLVQQNGAHETVKNGFKNHINDGKIKSQTTNRAINGLTNGLENGSTDTEIVKGESMDDNRSSGDSNSELAESHYDQRNNLDLMITAENNGLVNHNNNDISENNHITAKKNGLHCNGSVKHNLKELTLTARVSNNGLSRHNDLKVIQNRPRILFLCNHISTADVPLIMQSFSTLTNQSILWVLDAQFKLTNFGVVCGSHGDFFVAKNSFVDGSLRQHVLKYPDRNLLVLFPEGGFLRKRIDGSNRYAIRNNLPQTKYVTHPRFGAFKDLIDPSVGVTHIVDTTLMYDDIKNPLSILDILFGNKKEPVILHHRVYQRSEINPTEEWLRNIWLEKDKSLTQYYEDRASVMKRIEETFRVVVLDWFKILSVHLFFFLVCYLTMFRLFNATSVTMLKARELYYSNI